jgi:hypothetical protein
MKYFSLVLLLFIVVGCGQNATTNEFFYFEGKIDQFQDDSKIYVNCSSQLNKTNKDFGISCGVILNEETTVETEDGEEVSKEHLRSLSTENEVYVQVYIAEDIELEKGNKEQVATKLVIVN